jgi:hypothetical protein
MKIQLSNPCTIDPSKIINGYCSECKKDVVDYSEMTDADMLAYISLHGLGCGNWREDQLNRPLQPKRSYLKYIGFSILLLWFLPVKAQSQIDSTRNIDEAQRPYKGTIKRLGEGNIVSNNKSPKETIKPNLFQRIFNRKRNENTRSPKTR